MTNVPTPPPAEQKRQKVVHMLRARRVELSDLLRRADYADNSILGEIQTINSQIEMSKFMREPFPDTEPEPSLDEIRGRIDEWYWEPWDEDVDDEDDSEE